MTTSRIIGFDAGNSEATLVVASGGKSQTLTIPSFLGSGSLEALRRVRGGAGSGDGLAAGEYVLEQDAITQFAGTLALEQSADSSSARGDIGRYWSGHTLRLLMVLAGSVIKEPAFSLRVVTGLPVTVWNRATTVPQVQRALCGKHHFILNGRPRTMTVEGVMVLMEGAGALAAYGLNEEVPQAVVDTGARTTDLFWAQGMRPMLPRCTGFAIGVGNVADRLGAWFSERYGRALSEREARAILWATAQHRPLPTLYVDGAPLVFAGEVERMVAAVGQEVVREVSRAWRSGESGKVAAEAARVLYIGGGSYYFAPLLQRLVPQLHVPRSPELANAQGYAAVGQQLGDAAWAKLRP